MNEAAKEGRTGAIGVSFYLLKELLRLPDEMEIMVADCEMDEKKAILYVSSPDLPKQPRGQRSPMLDVVHREEDGEAVLDNIRVTDSYAPMSPHLRAREERWLLRTVRDVIKRVVGRMAFPTENRARLNNLLQQVESQLGHYG